MTEKACKICGELFVPDKPSNTICKRKHYVDCPVCGKPMEWNTTRTPEPCSKACRKELTRQYCLAKYGVEHPMQSKLVQANHKKSMQERWGVESPLQCEAIKEKAIKSNREKFGSDWALGSKEIREKSAATMIERYGAKTTLESSVLRQKVEETCLERYGYANPSKNVKIENKISNVSYLQYSANEDIVRAFADKLQESNLEYKIISDDIILPEKKVIFKIDQSFSHNSYNTQGVPKDYHLKKTQATKEAGFQCIHVFDWDDWEKVINIVADKKPVYARNCTIYKLQSKVADEFLNKYHIQGSVKNQLVCLGLVKDDELVQVMTFGVPRYNKNYSAELLRLCTKPGIALVGGAEKLFKFATKVLDVDDIISYCDLSKFSGAVYTRMGMKFETFTEPQEIWSRGEKKITANMLRRYGYDNLFGTDFGKQCPNDQLMIRDGWLPVYDCGQAVFTYLSE